jgi:hypothetical protein
MSHIQSMYYIRLARDARDALRIELESTISEHESHSREAVNRLKEQLRSAQVRCKKKASCKVLLYAFVTLEK